MMKGWMVRIPNSSEKRESEVRGTWFIEGNIKTWKLWGEEQRDRAGDNAGSTYSP